MTETIDTGQSSAAAQPGMPVRAVAAQLGTVNATLGTDLGAESALVLEATAQKNPFLPLKLVNPATGEELSTVCRISKQLPLPDSNKVRLELALKTDDHALLDRLEVWLRYERAPAANPSPAQAASSVSASEATAADGAGPEKEAPQPVLSAEERKRANEKARLRAERRLQEADEAKKKGRPQEAFTLIEEALALYPLNADGLHLELAEIALEQDRVDVAEEHARAAATLTPSHPRATAMLKRIAAARAHKTETARDRVEQVTERQEKRAAWRSLAAVGGMAALMVAVVLVNVWYHILPRGEAPRTLDTEVTANVLPATAIRVSGDTMFVTTDPATWKELDNEAKTQRLKRLLTLGRGAVQAKRVVVAGPSAELLGMINPQKTSVYR
jgi:tetratricopeptide (TPR) repeat protein